MSLEWNVSLQLVSTIEDGIVLCAYHVATVPGQKLHHEAPVKQSGTTCTALPIDAKSLQLATLPNFPPRSVLK